ncbi:unnamed protein product [Adineta ricciae]|uniref:SH3 domain-containing protein n=1 Tax=Adineta ricciae TaxID=249248 RepID=A0A814HXH2_ADIRI|nr:unnamed protein product [Adineta ricciae]
MSSDRLRDNFQELLRTFHKWPTSTIEKSVLVQILQEFQQNNPELKNIYYDVSSPIISHHVSNHKNNEYSCIDAYETSLNQFSAPTNFTQTSIPNEILHTKKERSLSSSNNTLVKEGELTVRKSSTVLSPLVKKGGFKTVRGELSYACRDKEKIVHLSVYQKGKSQNMIHTFVLDNTCSFVYGSKKEFEFKHSSGIEYFTTETGTANSWIDALSETVSDQIEEIYENPDALDSTSIPTTLEYLTETPVRVPPRPTQFSSGVLPKNIYVCLYDYHPTTGDSHELSFNRGDLLYIINTDGPNFYIGRQFTFHSQGHFPNPIGLVFKDYIRSAYEKVHS